MAKIYLDNGEGFIIASPNAIIYGSSGNENVTINSSVTGVTTDQNIEKVIFGGAIGDYKFKQAGNTLMVYGLDGVTSYAVMPLQGDSDGTQMQFGASTYDAKLTSGVMKLGGSTVGDTIASTTGVSAGSTSTATTGSTTTTTPTTPTTVGSFNLDKSIEVNANATKFSVTNTGYYALSTLEDTNVKTLYQSSYVLWDKKDITYSFNTTAPAEYANYTSRNLTDGFKELSSWQKDSARDTFKDLSNYLNMTFNEVSSNGDIRFSSINLSGNEAGLAFQYFAMFKTMANAEINGDIFLSNVLQVDPQYLTASGNAYGSYGRVAIYHEVGHAMGLSHPFESFLGGPTLSVDEDNRQYTVMSYTDKAPFVVNNHKYSGEAYTPGYSIYDIDALQTMYGANTSYKTGDDTYTFNGKTPYYLTIWDAGGHDKIDASTSSGDCVINLNSNTLSSVNLQQYINPDMYRGENNLGIVKGVAIEDVATGLGNDKITDNVVNNAIDCQGGDDSIYLYFGGYDTVIGGSGTDNVYVKDNAGAVTKATNSDGTITIVGSYFSAVLSGIEKIYYGDGSSDVIA